MISVLNCGGTMKGFVQGTDRQQTTLLPECLDDWVDESNPVRAVDVFVEALELATWVSWGDPGGDRRPAYTVAAAEAVHLRLPQPGPVEPAAGARGRAQSSKLMWLTGRLAPDHKTIADFRKDHGPAIQAVCAQFVVLCRRSACWRQAVARSMAASSRR